MKNAGTAFLVVMLFSSLGLWGCTHQKNGAYHAKIRELESRYAKLEEDYRVIVAANESNRKKIVHLENQRTELARQVEELKTIALERDELKKQLAVRTIERDAARGHMAQFRKDLQDIMGRVDTAMNETAPGAVNAVPVSRKTE